VSEYVEDVALTDVVVVACTTCKIHPAGKDERLIPWLLNVAVCVLSIVSAVVLAPPVAKTKLPVVSAVTLNAVVVVFPALIVLI
jgi:hypothetical protein